MFFFGHGNPMYAIGENRYARAWREIGERIRRPASIISVSAHWETDGTRVTASANPRTVHDFYGFPRELFEVDYPAPGDPGLANAIAEAIGGEIQPDDSRGLDHGTWAVLRHVFPDAGVPVVQISLDRRKSPREHFEFASRLGFLRDRDVLYICSGNVVHNLELVDFRRPDGDDWARRANETIKRLVVENDAESLIGFSDLGADVGLAVPTAEHFLPLLYFMALKRDDESVGIFNDVVELASLAMTSFEARR